jgi:hypothetical protein
MSIEDSIKAAVDAGRRGAPQDETFMMLRAEVRGAVIEAHRQLAPQRSWSINEDRLLDVLDHWLSTLRPRKGE